MPEFTINITETITFEVKVEADDVDEAAALAEEPFLNSPQCFQDFPFSIDDREVYLADPVTA